jgi:hypothetical protein
VKYKINEREGKRKTEKKKRRNRDCMILKVDE